jgi:hypothetical protein
LPLSFPTLRRVGLFSLALTLQTQEHIARHTLSLLVVGLAHVMVAVAARAAFCLALQRLHLAQRIQSRLVRAALQLLLQHLQTPSLAILEVRLQFLGLV